jgi:predicted RNA-binding Zn ribbon-like protein
VGGNLALDLANTISWCGTAREYDHLANCDSILAWAQEVGLVPMDFSLPDDKVDGLAHEVRALRDAVTQAGAAVAQGRPPPTKALATIRDLAARSLAAASPSGAPIELGFADEDRITGPIAWAALDLFRSGELPRLKQCPAEACRWLFIDRTKNGSRRWCDMATCGNQAKARRARALR